MPEQEKDQLSASAENSTESSTSNVPESTETTTIESTTTERPKKHHHEHEEEEEFKFTKDPIFDITYNGDCAYTVKITIPSENTKQQIEKNLNHLKEHAELPGFRKGKVPLWLIESKFGKAIRQEAKDKLISEAFKKLLEDKKLHLFGEPQYEGIEELETLPDDQDITCSVKFEVAPRCELGKYRGIELERKYYEPDDEMIEEELENMRTRYAIYESVPDATVQDGDQVVIDFSGTIDGEPFQGGSANNYPYIMGSKRFFGKFEEVLLGAKVGDKKTCEVEFPSDYPNTSLAGKTASFEIHVKDIKRKQLPELNDEFAKQIGFDSLTILKEKLKNDFLNDIKAESQAILEIEAIEKVIQDCTFEIPKSLIEEVTQSYIEDRTDQLLRMRIPVSEIEKQKEQIESKSREKALIMLKWLTAAQEIADAEGITVTDEDYDKEAEDILRRTGIDKDEILKYITSEGKSATDSRVIRRKALDLVLANAKITDKIISREEFEKLQSNYSSR